MTAGQRYEYVAVPARSGPIPKGTRPEDVLTERMNAVAEHGWRLVGVLPGGQYGGGQLLFERPIEGSDG